MLDMKSHITEPLLQAMCVKRGSATSLQHWCSGSASITQHHASLKEICGFQHSANVPQFLCVSIIEGLIQYGLEIYETNFDVCDLFLKKPTVQ